MPAASPLSQPPPPLPTPIAPIAIRAFTATTALGRGVEAQQAALLARRGGLRRNDFGPVGADGKPLPCWIGRVDGVEDAPLPAALAAKKRGVIFDIGHGMGSFDFGVARLDGALGGEGRAVELPDEQVILVDVGVPVHVATSSRPGARLELHVGDVAAPTRASAAFVSTSPASSASIAWLLAVETRPMPALFSAAASRGL